jgi:hypothetical protein
MGLELPQGQRTLTFNSPESSDFFLDFTLCPDSMWLLETATLLAGSCIFLKTEGKS